MRKDSIMKHREGALEDEFERALEDQDITGLIQVFECASDELRTKLSGQLYMHFRLQQLGRKDPEFLRQFLKTDD